MPADHRPGPWDEVPRRKRGFGVFLAGFVIGAAVVMGSVYLGMRMAAPSAVTPPAPLAAAASGGGIGPEAPAAFSAVYERVSPAVVSIYAATRRPALLVTPYGDRGPARLIPPMESLSSGSGFFISADGFIVTNNHVVEGAQAIVVALSDGQRLRAALVGRDPDTDLAVLRVDGEGYPFVNFSSAARPKVGEWVIAVGNPFGIGTTATAGIVSAYGKEQGDYLQLDAAINQGNSGGPSFDAEGRVVGVNTAIFSPTGAFVGIGFAIPADTAAAVTRRIIAAGG